MSFCKDCISGVTHEGTPKGKWEKIGGIDCYVGTPSVDYPKDKAIILCPDVFGPQLINCQLLVDDFAANGFKTIALDYFQGDPCPPDALDPGATFDFMGWAKNHGQDVTQPELDKVIAALKAEGVNTFFSTGYCYGCRFVFNGAFENVFKAVVANHPSFVEVPKDIEIYANKSKAPLLINSCEFDERFPQEAQAKSDEILGGGKFKPGYKREYFPGCTHGFAVRGDLSKPEVKAGREGSFKAAVNWFIEHQ